MRRERTLVKGPDGAGRMLPAVYASFGALQRGVVAFLVELPPSPSDPPASEPTGRAEPPL